MLASAKAAAEPAGEALAFIRHYRAAVEAYRNDDAAAMVEAARQVLAQVPDHATARYLLAVGRARQGWLGDAAQALGQLAQQGLTTRLEAVPAFAPLLSEARYAALRQQLIRNRQAQGPVQIVHELALPRFVPEGLARLNNGDLLLGSVHQARIVRIQPRGTDDALISDWAPAAQNHRAGNDTTDGSTNDGGALCSVLGMRTSRDGSQVYVATACMQQTAGVDSQRIGRSGIFVYAAEGRLLAAHWLPADDAAGHVLGDVLPWDEHSVITSDSLSGAILRLNLDNGQYTAISEPGVLPNPQGLAPAVDENGLYVADYQAGIFYLEVGSGRLQRLGNAPRVAMHGIDGLVRCDNTLVGIQNGVRPNRILALRLTADGRAIAAGEVLARGLAPWDEPTLGMVDGQRLLYVANSHWPRFDEQGRLPAEALDGPRLMAVPIPDCHSAGVSSVETAR